MIHSSKVILLYTKGRWRVVLFYGDKPRIYLSSKYRGKSLTVAMQLRDSLNLPLEYQGVKP